MGNPEFNGKKYDYWSADYDGFIRYGVWNNEMKAKQYVSDWDGIIAPDKESAIRKAITLNSINELQQKYKNI